MRVGVRKKFLAPGRGALLIAVFMSPMALGASEFPFAGILIGNTDGDILNYECSLTSDEAIECDFVQVLLRNDNNGRSLTEELQNAGTVLENIQSDRSICASLEAFDTIRAGGSVDDAELATAVEEWQKSDRELRQMHPRVQESSLRAIDAFRKLCRTRDIEDAEALVNQTHEIASQTCRPLVNKFSQRFVRVSDRLWVVESSPSGVCGVINTSRFYLGEVEDYFWNYEASKIITNKSGGEGGICANLDEQPQPYIWNDGPHFSNCVFLD